MSATNITNNYYDEEAGCDVFQAKENWEGHSSTHSSQWLAKQWYENDDNKNKNNNEDDKNNNHNVLSLKCLDSMPYEPYVVVPWCPMVETRTRTTMNHLVGNNKNKKNGKTQYDHHLHIRPLSPYYDERFHGYGKNKIQYFQHLRFLKYTFVIVPQGFVIHNPHVESKAKQEWKKKNMNNKKSTKTTTKQQPQSLHDEMDHLYPQFLNELVRLYGHDDDDGSGDGGRRRRTTNNENPFSIITNPETTFSWLQDYPGVIGLCPQTKTLLQNQIRNKVKQQEQQREQEQQRRRRRQKQQDEQ